MTKQGTYKNKAYNLRISDDLKYKLNFIKTETGYDALSILLVDVISDFVTNYEAEHGEIRVPEEEN